MIVLLMLGYLVGGVGVLVSLVIIVRGVLELVSIAQEVRGRRERDRQVNEEWKAGIARRSQWWQQASEEERELVRQEYRKLPNRYLPSVHPRRASAA